MSDSDILIPGTELQALELVLDLRWKGDLEKILVEGRAVVLGNGGFIVVGAGFATLEKAPAQVDGEIFIAFEDETHDVFSVEEKLQDEMGVGHLISLAMRQAGDGHGVWNRDRQLLVLLQGNGLETESGAGLKPGRQKDQGEAEPEGSEKPDCSQVLIHLR